MISAIVGPLISKPEVWVVVFDPVAQNRWIGLITPGRYKHVRAYGYVPFLHVWLFVDVNFAGVELLVAAHGEPANALAASWAKGCDLVVMPRRAHANQSLTLAASGWCVPIIKRLIGLNSGALRPDRLLADCLQNGGKLYEQQRTSRAPGDDAGHVGADTGLHPAAG